MLTENRSGLVVDTLLTQATGYGERSAAVTMLARAARRRGKRITAGGDRGYDTRDFVLSLRQLEVTPHVAQNTNKRSSRIDERTTRHPGYEISQRKRKRIEEVFGWMKTVGLMRKTRHRGSRRVGWMFTFTAAVYNLVRMRNLAAAVHVVVQSTTARHAIEQRAPRIVDRRKPRCREILILGARERHH